MTNTSNSSQLQQKCLLSDSTPTIPPVSIRIRLFYDGTLNNRTNVADTTKSTEFKNANDSYTSDTTNIAKLEPILALDSNADFSVNIYIEGIGTEDKKEDSSFGYALGQGDTGVKGKVKKCMKIIGKVIKKIVPSTATPIKYVYLDMFGFSRGAAAARYCTHLTLKDTAFTISLSKWLAKSGYTAGPVVVKFVGLYDTVASFGVAHWNDTSNLNLDSIKDAERVVQLAAADEHRNNFRLTNINSAGAKGTQVFLPGAHSDIGGSYVNNCSEDLILFKSIKGDKNIEEERKWLTTTSGWYKPQEITLEETTEYVSSGFSAVPVKYVKIKAKRMEIKNTYTYIPLNLMAKYANESGVIFKKTQLISLYSVPSKLRWINLEIKNINSKIHQDTQINNWVNDNREPMKNLRHDYLHFSAYYGATMGAHDPQFIDKKRKRTIQNG